MQQLEETSFRDRLGIVSREGKRRWVYPKAPAGAFHRARAVVASLLLAVLVGTPFVRIDGHPVMLIDVTRGRFIVFGSVFGPHDFLLPGLATITVIVFIVLFTVVFGRLFCGWICPQTVFMEMVFRKIDYLIEGTASDQSRLDASPWSGRKLRTKLLKHGVYFVLSLLVAFLLLAWVIGTQSLSSLVREPPSAHAGGLAALLLFAAGFHWIFGWFREQACILVCPYGRLQGVLLDRNSVVIAYDTLRGEPRGKLRRGEEGHYGDCIDCHQCVDVCPTGIDIRNGTQLECVNCTACIDACDAIMDSVGRPRGLVRYDSLEGIERGVRRFLTPRSISTSSVLVLLGGILVYLLATRGELDVTILRTPGLFFQEQADGYVSNLYDVKILNKTFDPHAVSFRLRSPGGRISLLGDSLVVPGQESASAKLFVLLERDSLARMNTPVEIDIIRDGGTAAGTVRTAFLGPVRSGREAGR